MRISDNTGAVLPVKTSRWKTSRNSLKLIRIMKVGSRVLDRLEKLKKLVADSHRGGTKVYMHIGTPIWPHGPKRRDDKCRIKEKLYKLHPEIRATLTRGEKKRKVSQYFCWSSDILRQIVLKNFDRIFAKVPDLDGLIIVIHNGGNGYLHCHCRPGKSKDNL